MEQAVDLFHFAEQAEPKPEEEAAEDLQSLMVEVIAIWPQLEEEFMVEAKAEDPSSTELACLEVEGGEEELVSSYYSLVASIIAAYFPGFEKELSEVVKL